MSYNPWGCKRVGHDLATKQQEDDKNHPINVQEILDKHYLDRFFFFFFLAERGREYKYFTS